MEMYFNVLGPFMETGLDAMCVTTWLSQDSEIGVFIVKSYVTKSAH